MYKASETAERNPREGFPDMLKCIDEKSYFDALIVMRERLKQELMPLFKMTVLEEPFVLTISGLSFLKTIPQQMKLYALNKKYLECLRKETEDSNWERGKWLGDVRNLSLSEWRSKANPNSNWKTAVPPSQYLKSFPGCVETINDSKEGWLYNWVCRFWEKETEQDPPEWISTLLERIFQQVGSKLKSKHKLSCPELSCPVQVLDAEKLVAHGRKELNIEGYEYIICLTREGIEDHVKRILPDITRARADKRSSTPEAHVARIAELEAYLSKVESCRSEVNRLSKRLNKKPLLVNKESLLDWVIELHNSLEKYVKNEIARIRSLRKEESFHNSTERTNAKFDRDARWCTMKRQMEAQGEAPGDIYLNIADTWAKEHKADFEKAWEEHNRIQREKGKREKSREHYKAITYAGGIRKQVQRFENEIAAVFP